MTIDIFDLDDLAESTRVQRGTFPRARHGRGYKATAVDTFLAQTRASFDGRGGQVTAAQIRSASFPLVKGGYDIAAVDQAMSRLEDAFARRERDRAVAESSPDEWLAEIRERAQEILDRLARGEKRRFTRTSALSFGYRVKEVDFVAERIARFLRDGEALEAEQVRQVAFRMQRRGYREEQVDALLDATVEIILAVS